MHTGSPLWGRRAVFPVGVCRSLCRIWANSFSVPHRPVLSPCTFVQVVPLCCLGGGETGSSPPMSDGFFVDFFGFFGGGDIAPQASLTTLSRTSTRGGEMAPLEALVKAIGKSRVLAKSEHSLELELGVLC